MITSKSNQKLKKIRALMDSPKERRQNSLFVVEGSHLVEEVPAELMEEVYVSASFAKNGVECIPCDVSYEVVSDEAFKSLSDTVNPQGILAVVRMPSSGMEKVLGADLYVLLDDIRDPGNLGTIVRTAEAAGARVILSPKCVDIYNPKVVRSTMGTIFRVPFAFCNMTDAVNMLREEGVTVCAAVLDGSVPYTELDADGAVAFIIGNEANGVSAEAAECADKRVRIPMKGMVESLNAAVSAAILMYSRLGRGGDNGQS